MKKRLLAMLLAGAMVFGLAACGGGNEPAETPAGETPAAETPAGETPAAEGKTIKVGMVCIGEIGRAHV